MWARFKKWRKDYARYELAANRIGLTRWGRETNRAFRKRLTKEYKIIVSNNRRLGTDKEMVK